MPEYRFFEIVCKCCGVEFEERHKHESDGELMFWLPENEYCNECMNNALAEMTS